jgi:hypothetical protein
MALYLSGARVANVELSDTFNVWRLRTNQINSDASSISGNNTFTGVQTFDGTVTFNANTTLAASNTDVTGYMKFLTTGQITVPVGNTAQRVEDALGGFRYNNETATFEGYGAEGWGTIGGGGLGVFTFQNSNYTADSGDRVAADTSSGSWTLTLPAGPANEDIIEVIDQEGSFNVNNLTIDRNGSTIEGLTEDLVADVSGSNFYLQYNGTTWIVFGIASGVQYFESTLSVGNLTSTANVTAQNALIGANALLSQNVRATGNVHGTFIFGDGSNLTNAGSSVAVDGGANRNLNIPFTGISSGTMTSANVSSSLQFNPSTGTVTATAFVGDGSGLTNAGVTVNDDTTTNTDYYVLFTGFTTGTATVANVASTKLYFNPSSGQLSATDFNSLSDIRFKDNIETLQDASAVIDQLRGVSFNWKDNGNKAYGLIAQEVQDVLPEIVEQNDSGALSVRYLGLIAYLIESNKELQERVARLESQVNGEG